MKAGIAAHEFVAADARQRHLETAGGGGLADEPAVDTVDARHVHGSEQPVPLAGEILAPEPAEVMGEAQTGGSGSRT